MTRLERLPREQAGEPGMLYGERWLQHLIHAHPEVLPITETEPAFEPAIPVCIELPMPRGSIDNFFITPTGNLLFAECKLWRNPEARRQVVAQVMDYVESITSWGYAGLEKAVERAQLPDGSRPQKRLYDLVGVDQELDETEFVNAVSRNLRLGRGLFFIVGDGIREETEALTAHLQAHAGLHFALALVELALFRLPAGSVLVQPRTIARTINIERGIIRFDDARISVKREDGREKTQRPRTLTEEQFYERIAKRDPGLPDLLRAFIERLEPVGVTPEFKKSLILRWRAPDGTTRNVGYIKTDGYTWTDAVNWGGSQLGILDITHEYVRELAEAIGGEVKVSSTNNDYRYAALKGHAPRIEQILKHEDAWVRAIERLSERVIERLEARSE